MYVWRSLSKAVKSKNEQIGKLEEELVTDQDRKQMLDVKVEVNPHPLTARPPLENSSTYIHS